MNTVRKLCMSAIVFFMVAGARIIKSMYGGRIDISFSVGDESGWQEILVTGDE